MHKTGLGTVQLAGSGFGIGAPARGTSGEAAVKVVAARRRTADFVVVNILTVVFRLHALDQFKIRKAER